MKSWKYEKDASTGEVYAVYHSVPIFKEHTGSDGTKYTQELLEDIADNNNDRIEETGDYCPIVGWHTPSDNDPSKDPPIIGFAENFRVEKFGKKKPKWCIYATFKIRKEKHDYFRDHPRRSVEIWPEDKPENRYIDPIAVLGAETPRQDLGLVYSKSAAGEESYMYSSVAGGGNTYVPGEVERSAKGEVNPEGLQEDHPNRLKPSGYDSQHTEILSNLFPSAGQETVAKGERVAVRRFLNTAQEELKPHYDLFGVTDPKRQKITSQTIHKVKKSGTPDYSRNSGNHGVVTLNDVSFNVNQKLLAGIARGGSKTPMASGVGSYAHSDPVDVSSDEYDEVDFNPKRGHLFALVSDSKTNDKLKAGHAIAGADEATFINNRVFVKNARPVTEAGDPGHEDQVEFMTEDGKTASSHPHGKDEASSKYDKPGPKDPRRTPAPKKDRVKGSSKNPKGSASKANEKIEVSDKTESSLKKKMQEHNKKGKGSKATIGALKSVYRRGAGAFSTSHAPKMSRHGGAMARVNAFLTLLRTGKPDNSNYKQDNDLLPKGHPKKSKNSKGGMAMEYAKDEEGKEPDKHYAQLAAALAPIAGELIGGMMSGRKALTGGEDIGDQNAKRTGPRPIRKPRAKGFKFDKDEMPQDVPGQDDVLDGDDEMALDQQSVQQIVEGLKPTIIDIVQEEIASIVGDEGMGPEDMLEDQEVEVVPDEEVEDMLDEEPEDAVMADEKDKEDEPERNAKEHEDDPDKEAKCGYGKEMFEKVAEKHRLYEKDADHKGASQYMASMEEADKNAMDEYMKSDKAESHEKEAFRKCGSYGKDMKESYSKDSEIAEADKYRKELKQESEKYSKLQQQYSKLQSELVEAKDQLTEVRRSERYHKIADRLANLEAEGYSFDKERELEFCMQLSDDLREEHLAERIPQQYAKCPIGAPIPVEESEELKPIEQKSIKYSRSANLATQKLRAQGHKGVSFDKVLKHMCDNDTDECPSVEDLK